MPGTRQTRKAYVVPELKIMGDVAKLTREHAGSSVDDLPFGSQDEIKSTAH
jgi:hypothetical protein